MGLQSDKQFVFHITRHTFASRLVQSGIGIQIVQDLLGHKTIKMTLRYAHLAPHNKTEARMALERSDKSGVKLAKVVGIWIKVYYTTMLFVITIDLKST